MDRIRALEVVCAIADANSLAGASRALAVSPPTITRVLNDLEAHLGTRLFHRSTRAVSLTEAGLVYVSDARRILDQLTAADDNARGARSRPTGTLRVTAPVLFGQLYVAPILDDYVSHFPDVRVDAFFVDRVVGIVDEGYDLAVRIGELEDSDLRATRVGSVRRVVCGSPEYLEAKGALEHPRDLADHEIIHSAESGGPCTWQFDDGISVRLEPRMTYSTLAACIASARSGRGITRVLSYQVAADCEAGALRPVLTDFLRRDSPIHLVHAEGRLKSAKVREFLDLAVDRLRSDARLAALAQSHQLTSPGGSART